MTQHGWIQSKRACHAARVEVAGPDIFLFFLFFFFFPFSFFFLGMRLYRMDLLSDEQMRATGPKSDVDVAVRSRKPCRWSGSAG